MLDSIKYERLEDFLCLLKAADSKKTHVYVDVIRLTGEDNVMTMKISFMIIREGFLHQCIFGDNMPEMLLVPEGVFSVLSTEKLRKDALNDYHRSLQVYDDSVKAEYQKAEDLIRDLGYMVVMGVVQ
jgi:hypothetical protein